MSIESFEHSEEEASCTESEACCRAITPPRREMQGSHGIDCKVIPDGCWQGPSCADKTVAVLTRRLLVAVTRVYNRPLRPCHTSRGSRIIFRTWINFWQCGIRVLRVLYHSIYDPLHLSLLLICRFVRNNLSSSTRIGSLWVSVVSLTNHKGSSF